MEKWQDLGLVKRSSGEEFSPAMVTCPFCAAKARFSRVYRGEKLDNIGNVELYSDVWQCIACANFVFVEWHSDRGFYEYRVYPAEHYQRTTRGSWSEKASHAYSKAVDAFYAEDWDTTIMLTRNCIGIVTKEKGVNASGLAEEISELHTMGLIPRTLVDWGLVMDQLKPVGDESETKWSHDDAKEIMRFTRYMMDLLYTLPYDAQLNR